MRAWQFNPVDLRDDYLRLGWQHASGGATPEFLEWARAELRRSRDAKASLDDLHIAGKKSQFLFEFPDEACRDALLEDVATLTGRQAPWTLAERHIKVYDEHAPPTPPPHLDRLASEIAIGFVLDATPASHLVLYPDKHVDVNVMNTSKAWRNSLDEVQLPEHIVEGCEPIRIHAQPGDVVMFRGNAILHERLHAAGSEVLYFKLNSMGLDPLGEDHRSDALRRQSLEICAAQDDEALLDRFVTVSQRLLGIQRHYTRAGWQQVVIASVAGEGDARITETELSIVLAVSPGMTARTLCRRVESSTVSVTCLRRLVQLGLLDLGSR